MDALTILKTMALGVLVLGFTKLLRNPQTEERIEKRKLHVTFNLTVDPTEAPKSSQIGDVIVQLFEWSWKDIAEECRSFLPKHGYTAVQTSPVTEHIVLKTSSWTDRYQPISYKINSRSGNEEDFRNMVKACNEHKIKVYVDVILNHMSERLGSVVGIGGSRANTTYRKYPGVPYEPSDFHPCCQIKDWNDPWQVRNYELEKRNDLNQTRQNVRDRIAEFLNKLIDIGVAGFRVSDAKHIDVEDLAAIYSRVKDLNTTYFVDNSRPYIYHEVSPSPLNFRPFLIKEPILPSDYLEVGAVEDLQFSYVLSQVFSRKKPLSRFNLSDPNLGLLNWNKSVVFIDNHITQRGRFGDLRYEMTLSYFQKKGYKMAVGFMLAWPHFVARVMSGYDFSSSTQPPPSGSVNCSGEWVCEHRWRQIYNMIHFRKTVFDSEVSDWWSKGNYQIAFCRRGKGFVAFNLENNKHLNATLQTCLPRGVYCDVISGSKTDGNSCSGKRVAVNEEGRADIILRHDEEDGMLAIHIGAKID